MKVIGNIKSGSFKSLLGKFTAPADQLSSKAASRFGEYTQAAFDERFPTLHEEDEGEGEEEAPEDAGGAYARTTRTVRSVLTPREMRRVEREQGLNLRRQAARGELDLDDDEDDDFMPPANRGEILDAAEGLVDILSGMPQTPTVRSLLADVGALVGDMAAEPTGPAPKKKLGAKVKEATAPVRAKAQARFQRFYDSAVNDVFGEEDEGVGQTVGPSIPYNPEAREYDDEFGECEYDERDDEDDDDDDDGSSGLIVVGDLADEESGYAGEEEDFQTLRDVTKRIHRGYHSEE